MIHLVQTFPYIEKIARGERTDEQEFVPNAITYRLNNTAIIASKYLLTMKEKFCVHGIIGRTTSQFMDTVDYLYPIYMDKKNEIRVRLDVDEENIYELTDERVTLTQQEEQLFTTIVASTMSDDVVVLVEDEDQMRGEYVAQLHQQLKQKNNIMIGCLHPTYLSFFKPNAFNVLALDYLMLKEYYQLPSDYKILDIVEFVKATLSELARILVVSISSNCILVFVDGKCYQAVHKVKDPLHQNYMGAIIAGILKCYEIDGDIHCLLREALSRSIGASLSNNLYVPTEDTILQIKEKIIIHEV